MRLRAWVGPIYHFPLSNREEKSQKIKMLSTNHNCLVRRVLGEDFYQYHCSCLPGLPFVSLSQSGTPTVPAILVAPQPPMSNSTERLSAGTASRLRSLLVPAHIRSLAALVEDFQQR